MEISCHMWPYKFEFLTLPTATINLLFYRVFYLRYIFDPKI